MQPDPKVISNIVERWTGLTVALYAGCPGNNTRGRLLVAGQDGHVADDIPALMRKYLGGGNVVDLPALEWLRQGPSPRIWVSDGHVTGVGDRGSPAMAARAGEICREAGVRRVLSLREAAAGLG
jgi:hypothetical protein